MNYTIHTPSAVKLKREIFERVSEKIDGNGKGIAAWQCVEADTSDRVLVHTSDQWAEKGCLAIQQVPGCNQLQIRFHYWESCEDKSIDDEKIMLGRFTELLLVHFSYSLTELL